MGEPMPYVPTDADLQEMSDALCWHEPPSEESLDAMYAATVRDAQETPSTFRTREQWSLLGWEVGPPTFDGLTEGPC